MTSQPRASGDGVRVVPTSAKRRVVRVAFLAMGGVVLVVVIALLGLRVTAAGRAPRPADRNPETAAAAPPAARRPLVEAPPAALAQADAPPPGTRTPTARARPKAAAPTATDPPEKEDAPFTIDDSKEPTGMRLFPPMGTKPIKRGVIVPDDFELPPGYVRHFQSTDDGERLPAILMFSPDYEWMDAQGRPIALPPDRVVPPDMAPPGLRIEMLEPPAQKPPPSGPP